MDKTPRPGEIFYLTKDKPYQVITMGIHKETCESMVIYQALFGEYSTFVLSLAKFIKEVEGENGPGKVEREDSSTNIAKVATNEQKEVEKDALHNGEVNHILLSFLDADFYSDKLDVITSHIKEMDDKLINNMAASLDCTVDDGPMDERLQGLIYCLKQLSRFEIRR